MGNRGISLLIILTISSFYFVSSGVDNHSIDNDITPIELSEAIEKENIVSTLQSTEFDNYISEDVKITETSESIETNSITSEVHSPGRDSYIVDFGFHQTYTYKASQVMVDDFKAYVAFNESVYFSVDLTIPVNITLQYSDSVTAGKKTTVLANLYKVPGGASFSVSYGFTLGGAYRIMLGSLNTFELLNYENSYEFLSFDVPLDPVPLTDFSFPLPLGLIPVVGPVIDTLFGVDLIMSPQLDVDISADLYFEGLGDISMNSINFETEEQQSFTIDIDSFSESKSGVKFGLTNFSMDFYLSLLWSIQLKLKGFFDFLGPWRLDLFTYPRLPIGGLAASGETYGLLDILPTDELPEYSLDMYSLDDSGNGVLEPGESGAISADFINIGDGPAINANISVSSTNITINSGNTGENFFTYTQDSSFTHDITFSLSAGYTGRNITVYYDIFWLAANGSIRYQQEELLIRVLQTGDAFLSIDKWSTFEPLDSLWDANEVVKFNIDISKVGTADIIYAELEMIGYYSSSTFTSNKTLDIKSGSFTIWNSSAIFMTAPSDITDNYIDIVFSLTYQLSTGEIYYDEQILTFDIYPLTAIIDLVGVYGTLISGTDDGVFMAGETISITATLENYGNDISSNIIGGFFTDEPDIILQDDIFIEWNPIAFGFSDISTNGLTMEINPRASNKTIVLYLVIAHETWYGELIFDTFAVTLDIVQQVDPVPLLNYYEVYDSTIAVSDLSPDEIFLITVGVDVSNGPAYDTIAYLTSDNENIFIYNDTSFYGDLYPGDMVSEGDGFIVYIPANFVGGNVRFHVNVTMHNGVGDLIYQLAYFDVVIAAGDTDIPTYSLDTQIEAKEGDTFSITISASDNIGIEEIYFTYYDYTNNEWIVQLLDWTTTPTVSVDITMGGDKFMYAFIIFDVSGNSVGAGLETPLEVNIPDTSVPSGQFTFNGSVSLPEATPPTPTMKTSLNVISIITGFILIPIIIRKKRN